jgi:glycosyltransferase involved in cell wall biosynthesis
MSAVCFIVQNPYEMDIRVRRKAEALVAAGYSVDAIALRSAKSPEKEFTLNGVKVYTISLGKMRGSLGRYVFEYVAFVVIASLKLSALMRRRHYIAVDINTLPDFLVFAGWYARCKGAKLVLDMHEITPEFFMSKYAVGEKHWLVRLSTWLERISFRYADYVLTINEPIQRLLESRGLDRVKSTIIMNAADDLIFSGETSPVEKGNAFVMMYHGTLTNIYGLDIAIEALRLAQKEIPNAEFWILGDGPERSNLEALARRLGIEKKVKFIGRVLPQEIPNWLKQCDIGVLATRSDVFLDYSFSNKLSEYIITGKAVISSRLRTIRHYFDEQALAFFEPNQPASLARQMVRVHDDKALRESLVMRARQQYAPINWSVMKERYLGLVNRICGVPEPLPGGTGSALPTSNLAEAVSQTK